MKEENIYGEVGVINMNNQINNQVNQNANMNMGPNSNVSAPGIQGQNLNPGLKQMPKAAQNNPKYTENWLPLKAISNGIMYNNKNDTIFLKNEKKNKSDFKINIKTEGKKQLLKTIH